MPVSKCILKNLRKGEAKDLPDIVIEGHQKKIIGRNTETMIESSSVSREHRKLNCQIVLKTLNFIFDSSVCSSTTLVVVKPKLEDSVILVRFIGKSPAGKHLELCLAIKI